jgi:hypothetical protein
MPDRRHAKQSATVLASLQSLLAARDDGFDASYFQRLDGQVPTRAQDAALPSGQTLARRHVSFICIGEYFGLNWPPSF